MGLTIHWNLKFKGSEAEVKEKLHRVKQIAENLPFEEVGPLWKLDYSKDFNNDAENKRRGLEDSATYRWSKIQYQPESIKEGNIWKVPEDQNKYKGWVVMLWADPGCESTNIGLISKDGKNWTGGAFTKTQYAEHFVQSHLLVIKILDVCKGLGILKDVNDEADYWKTRDLNVLGKNINESTAFIEKIAGMLRQACPGEQMVSAVDKSKNYMKIKGGEKKVVPERNRIKS